MVWFLATAVAQSIPGGFETAGDSSYDDYDWTLPDLPGPRDDGPRGIVNGAIDTDDTFPSTVFLVLCSENNECGVCTGTLIHPEWILTAAHCVVFEGGGNLALADVNFGIGGSAGFLGSRGGVSYAIHPEYNGVIGTTPDLALIEMNAPVNSIESIALNDETLTTGWLGVTLDVVGYGLVADDADNSGGVRRWADVDIYGYDDIYVGTADATQNACFGDSGGPMYRRTNGGLELVGVNSFVSGGCVNGTAAATRVDRYIGWIGEFVPELRLSAAEPPVVVDKPPVERNLDAEFGPNTAPPAVDAPEWPEAQRPDVGLYRELSFSCAHGSGMPFGALGLSVLLLAAARREQR